MNLKCIALVAILSSALLVNAAKLFKSPLQKQIEKIFEHYAKHEHPDKQYQTNNRDQHLQLRAADESGYVLEYYFTDESCSSESAIATTAYASDMCQYSEGSFLAVSYHCNEFGMEARVYVAICAAEYLYATASISSANLDTCYPSDETPAVITYVDSDDDWDDDGDDGNDDDDFMPATHYAFVCSNTIGYDFANGPAYGTFSGSFCTTNRVKTEYYKETACSASHDAAASVSCESNLTVLEYNTTTCGGTAEVFRQQTVQVCESYSLFDDDDDWDDDGDDAGDDDGDDDATDDWDDDGDDAGDDDGDDDATDDWDDDGDDNGDDDGDDDATDDWDDDGDDNGSDAWDLFTIAVCHAFSLEGAGPMEGPDPILHAPLPPVPSPAPSPAPVPGPSPTPSPEVQLTFQSLLTLNMDATSPTLSKGEGDVIVKTIDTVLNIAGAAITLLTTNTKGVVLRGWLGVQPVDVTFRVSLITKSEADATESYNVAKNTLEDSVEQGTFTTVLQEQAEAADMETLKSADATHITVDEPVIEVAQPTPAPTTASKNDDDGNTSILGGNALIIVIVACAVALIAIGVVIGQYATRRSAPIGSPNQTPSVELKAVPAGEIQPKTGGDVVAIRSNAQI